MSPEPTFQEVLQAAKRAEEWAWAHLFRQFSAALAGYLASRGAADPDDIANEVLMQVVGNIGAFEGDESSFRSWVFVIAHNRLIDERRYRSRRPGLSHAVALERDSLVGGNVEAEAIESIRTAEIQAAFDVLTDNQRGVLKLRVIAGLSLAETASVLSLSVGAVKQAQRRGLANLRDQFDETE